MSSGGSVDPSSRAEFSGVMVIETVTTPNAAKPKTLVITGAFYNGGPVMGAFRYYNGPAYEIEPGSRCFVHTTVRSYCFFVFLLPCG